ncbi:MAG: tRNA (N(6)-L-threonylcarbamoyladenosine(37)-C(2))-methylthiotransferase MtaB [Firmicutes bacterium]|nr:tRNA (N(6)-L-threonylcarbamoyladenosine(37)-C(2))-methylthiotransferase MtaB [Bacillota bacterium]
MKFKIVTLGCKVNTYESEMMREKLIASNYEETLDNNADVVIINTCSVTNMADAKSRKLINYNKRENPNAIMVVCGCSAQNKKEELSNLDIDILIGNNGKSNIVDLIEDYKNTNEKYINFINSRKLEFEDMEVEKFTNQTRAYIKIQDGCNNFCAYCIIPFMRGNIRSKDMSKVIEEANILVNNGHKEIVLTGIDTGSYGKDKNYDLTDLLNELVKIEGLKRIRLSSIDTFDLDDKFIECLKNNDKICDHLHISLQSGSNKILKLMNRKYTCEEYLNTINKIRNVRPDISITTDVIVGFPQESDEDFNEVLDYVNKVKFSKVHVFPFSKRDGTKASIMDGQVQESVKKARAKKLIEVSDELEKEYYSKFLGKELEVLVEENIDGKSIGHTSNYIKVEIDGTLNRNEFYKVKITSIEKEYVIGELVK